MHWRDNVGALVGELVLKSTVCEFPVYGMCMVGWVVCFPRETIKEPGHAELCQQWTAQRTTAPAAVRSWDAGVTEDAIQTPSLRASIFQLMLLNAFIIPSIKCKQGSID